MSQRSTRDLLSEKITTAVGREEKLPDSDTYYTNTYMCTCIYMVKVDVICLTPHYIGIDKYKEM